MNACNTMQEDKYTSLSDTWASCVCTTASLDIPRDCWQVTGQVRLLASTQASMSLPSCLTDSADDAGHSHEQHCDQGEQTARDCSPAWPLWIYMLACPGNALLGTGVTA